MGEMSKKPSLTQTPNGIFIKLAVVAFCLSLSSSVAFALSFFGGRLAYGIGSPSDEAILYSFLYGLVISQIATLFFPSSRISPLFSKHFLRVFLRSLVIVVPCWLVVALLGSRLVVAIIYGFFTSGLEVEWFQISLVLLSASITLLTWHILYHKEESTSATEQNSVEPPGDDTDV